MNDLQMFDYNSNKVRIVTMDGEPWFVLRDVCDVIGLDSPHKVADRLDEDERNQIPVIDSLGRQQETTVINESGLYNVIIRSDKPEAKAFKRWLTHDVLPSIRKHGMYATDDLINDPDLAIRAFTQLKIEREKRAALAAQNAIMAPKAEFFDAVAESKDAIDLGSAAKVLNMGVGRNGLFDFMRENGILMPNNQPYQKYIDQGYFRTIEQKYTKPDGTTCINIKTLVYQKGLDFIRKQLAGARAGKMCG